MDKQTSKIEIELRSTTLLYTKLQLQVIVRVFLFENWHVQFCMELNYAVSEDMIANHATLNLKFSGFFGCHLKQS